MSAESFFLLYFYRLTLLNWHAGCLSPVCLVCRRICQFRSHGTVAGLDPWPRPGSLHGRRQHSHGHVPDRWGCWAITLWALVPESFCTGSLQRPSAPAHSALRPCQHSSSLSWAGSTAWSGCTHRHGSAALCIRAYLHDTQCTWAQVEAALALQQLICLAGLGLKVPHAPSEHRQTCRGPCVVQPAGIMLIPAEPEAPAAVVSAGDSAALTSVSVGGDEEADSAAGGKPGCACCWGMLRKQHACQCLPAECLLGKVQIRSVHLTAPTGRHQDSTTFVLLFEGANLCVKASIRAQHKCFLLFATLPLRAKGHVTSTSCLLHLHFGPSQIGAAANLSNRDGMLHFPFCYSMNTTCASLLNSLFCWLQAWPPHWSPPSLWRQPWPQLQQPAGRAAAWRRRPACLTPPWLPWHWWPPSLPPVEGPPASAGLPLAGRRRLLQASQCVWYTVLHMYGLPPVEGPPASAGLPLAGKRHLLQASHCGWDTVLHMYGLPPVEGPPASAGLPLAGRRRLLQASQCVRYTVLHMYGLPPVEGPPASAELPLAGKRHLLQASHCVWYCAVHVRIASCGGAASKRWAAPGRQAAPFAGKPLRMVYCAAYVKNAVCTSQTGKGCFRLLVISSGWDCWGLAPA